MLIQRLEALLCLLLKNLDMRFQSLILESLEFQVLTRIFINMDLGQKEVRSLFTLILKLENVNFFNAVIGQVDYISLFLSKGICQKKNINLILNKFVFKNRSKSGGPVASAYASLVKLGEEGFLKAFRTIMDTIDYFKAEITKIDGLKILGNIIIYCNMI
jgi:hypothetical protein